MFLPKHIGGPGTRLPRFIESILSWIFAIGCLSVALWHYHVDGYRTKTASADHFQRERHRNRVRVRLRLPLTTHSRREWSTVSEYQGLRTRYLQLLEIIYKAIIASQTKPSNGEKKDDGEAESSEDNEYVIVDQHQENQATQLERQLFSMGEAVQKWLSVGSIVPTTIESLRLTQTTKKINVEKEKRFHGDETNIKRCRESREDLIQWIRTDEVARRLASLLLGDDPIERNENNRESKEELLDRLTSTEPGAHTVVQALQEIWPRLLTLPSSLPTTSKGECRNSTESIAISVIVPAFREDGGRLAAKIRASLERAIEPDQIEIVIVHVVEKDAKPDAKDKNHESRSSDETCPFAKILREQLVPTTTAEDSESNLATIPCSGSPLLRILEYHGGGGRGPCLNYGAKYANGDILTFLHADTRLATYGWDKAILKVLSDDGGDRPRITCCAFSFAIDSSLEALTVRTNAASDCDTEKLIQCNNSILYQQYYPPGLFAVEVTANLRCKMFSMPYGDQCLSLPKNVFQHVGGYPDQCLMEDYELIRLLRMRSVASLVRSSSGRVDSKSFEGRESIRLLSHHKALCSPRRWQNYGVLYVTYTNSYCVKRYNNGVVTPDELFCEYYGTMTAPHRMGGERSPWETSLMSLS